MALASSTTDMTARHAALNRELLSGGLDAVVINPGPSMTYLTGAHFHLSERPVVLIFEPGDIPAIVLPRMELAKIEALDFELRAFPYTEDLSTWEDAFRRAADACDLAGMRIGVEPRSLRVLELRLLESAARGASFVSGESVLNALRMFKDEAEIANMRKAVVVAQQALRDTLGRVKEGVTERDIASELTMQMLRGGSSPELPFSPIVAFGAESANPHASPRDVRLQYGDLVLIDWGANVHGYMSDLTRTFAFGEIDPELIRISRIVEEANLAAQDAAGPEVEAGNVDAAARRVITEAGYGDQFIHRTGHGLGLEAHEAPYIRAGNPELLKPGMAFTIEPGIYLPGKGGVRIEDDVVVTDDGIDVLSDAPRGLIQLA
jgi:Xaa-Pro dipeptidase